MTMIKKHPVWTILIALVFILLSYLVFNLILPNYIKHHEDRIVKIKGVDYEFRGDWSILKKDKLVGRVTQDNLDFGTRLGLLFLPDRLFSVQGDKEHISYYIDPGLSEFTWGYHIYRQDADLPELDNIEPYRIELGNYDFDLSGHIKFYTEDEELIKKIMSILQSPKENSYNYSEEDIEKLREINSEYYCICMFSNKVPGSVYQKRVLKPDDEWKVYIDCDDKLYEDGLNNITYAVYLLITEGIEIN